MESKHEIAVFGGGCFWCTETIYKKVEGITSLESGYTGGEIPNPTWEQVCTGKTGHVETLKIVFDTTKINLETILQIFFEIHDPTTLNYQGNDVGTEYASHIFYTAESQKPVIEKALESAQKNFKDNIVTQISPLDHFYKAEDYHQDYYAKHPDQPYCVAVISPKLQKFLKHPPQAVHLN